MAVRVKVLRSVWETGWSGASPSRPWSDREFTDAFASGFWSMATLSRVPVEFDIGPWTVLAGGSQLDLMTDRTAVLAACKAQADRDHVATTGYDHLIAFVHEPPSDTGVCGRDLVLDQTVPRWTRHRWIGRLLGFGEAPDDPYCVMSTGRGGLSAVTLHGGTTGIPTVHIGAGSVVTLTALGEARARDGPVLAILPVQGRQLTVEYRTNSGADAGIPAAVVLHSLSPDGTASFEAAMDPSPGTTAVVLGTSVTVRESSPHAITLHFTSRPPRKQDTMSTELHGQTHRDELGFPPEHRFAVMKTGALAGPSISIRTRRWQTAADIIVQGTGFTPGGDVVISMFGIPGHDSAPEVRTWQAGPNGTLHFEAEFGLVWGDSTDAAGALFVVARDETSQKAAFARLPHGCAAWIVIAH